MQLLLYVEEMQSQQRAENGVKEIVVGYVDDDTIILEDIDTDGMAEFANMNSAFEVASYHDLPPDILDVVLAENHRLATGEVLSMEAFKERMKAKEVN